MAHCYQYEYQVFQVQTLLVKFYLFFFLTLTNVTIHLFMVIVTFFPLDPIVRNLKRKKSTWIERTQREREDLKFFWKLQNSSCWSHRILLHTLKIPSEFAMFSEIPTYCIFWFGCRFSISIGDLVLSFHYEEQTHNTLKVFWNFHFNCSCLNNIQST